MASQRQRGDASGNLTRIAAALFLAASLPAPLAADDLSGSPTLPVQHERGLGL